jgi:uncharacterized protein (TIGR01777 family)
MTNLFWILITLDMMLGAFDIFYHHELTERLAWRPSQARELRLHGARNILYAVLFAGIGWTVVHGVFAMAVMALLVAEVLITLIDFVEEDVSRKLPASERVTHALLALNYGAILVLLFPVLLDWARQPTAILPAWHGLWSVWMGVASVAVFVLGLRDLAAASRAKRLLPPRARGLTGALPPRQSVLVTGATGFIGSRLTQALLADGHEVTVLTRDARKAAVLGAPLRIVTSLDQIEPDARFDAVVNLAGESMGEGLWTGARRKRLMVSRLQMAASVVDLIARLERRPGVLVNASAIGWYGLQDDETLTEESEGRDCFCREICVAWEAAAQKVARYGTRVALLRIGLVLGTQGGLLSRLLVPFEFGGGGRIGSGRQWMSWIERDDMVRAIAHVIATPSLDGAINATAPEPVRNADFARALGRALHRPALLPMPAFLPRLLGDFGKELLLGGQRVMPAKLLASGFRFEYRQLDAALDAMLGGAPDAPARGGWLPARYIRE